MRVSHLTVKWGQINLNGLLNLNKKHIFLAGWRAFHHERHSSISANHIRNAASLCVVISVLVLSVSGESLHTTLRKRSVIVALVVFRQKQKIHGVTTKPFFIRRQQSGAVEACWAHNPEVRRSKLRSANQLFLLFFLLRFGCSHGQWNSSHSIQFLITTSFYSILLSIGW